MISLPRPMMERRQPSFLWEQRSLKSDERRATGSDCSSWSTTRKVPVGFARRLNREHSDRMPTVIPRELIQDHPLANSIRCLMAAVNSRRLVNLIRLLALACRRGSTPAAF
jgi:hypothetical protein